MKAGGRWRGRSTVARNSAKQNLHLNHEELLERKLGFDLYTEGDKKLGWLLTFSPVRIIPSSLFSYVDF